MRKQIAAANWKMNLGFDQGAALVDAILDGKGSLGGRKEVILAVPFPYLAMVKEKTDRAEGCKVAAQNCHHKKSGAFTGEVSAEMLRSMEIKYCIIGHSERREYNKESNEVLADKVNSCLNNQLIPIFCCGETLDIRESGAQEQHVATQLKESLFHLDKQQMAKIIIAYEPVWAIGTGKTATTVQAQEMHKYLRYVLAGQFGNEVAAEISILYGGSVKPDNAVELFACEDVDGGLVGGASLVAADFLAIIKALK